MAAHNDLGKWGEEIAVNFLHKKGYTIRECDWRIGHRDIDIIALTPDMRTVVFVEVKTQPRPARQGCQKTQGECGKGDRYSLPLYSRKG